MFPYRLGKHIWYQNLKKDSAKLLYLIHLNMIHTVTEYKVFSSIYKTTSTEPIRDDILFPICHVLCILLSIIGCWKYAWTNTQNGPSTL